MPQAPYIRAGLLKNKFMIMVLFYILLGITIIPFILHFMLIPVSGYFIRNRRFYRNIIYSSKRYEFAVTSEKSLMLSVCHRINLFDEDDNPCEYSHYIRFIIGGFSLIINFGHDFLQSDSHYMGDKHMYFGLYSIDSELFWRSIWFKTHLYDNPFVPVRHIGTSYFDMDKTKDKLKACFIKRTDGFYYIQDHPEILYKEYNDTFYTCKDGKVEPVSRIVFYIEQRLYTLPLLHWLHLDNLYTKRYLGLGFDTTGIGVDKGWDGQVMSSDIKLSVFKDKDNDYAAAMSLYNLINSFRFKFMNNKKKAYYIDLLDNTLQYIITRFMCEDKKY